VLLSRGALPAALVVGGDKRGRLYGVFALLRRLCLGEGLPAAPIAAQPSTSLHILGPWGHLDGSVERDHPGRPIRGLLKVRGRYS
jgi:alpha-glucuronidase